MPREAVFLDRDGTLIEEAHYLADPAQVGGHVRPERGHLGRGRGVGVQVALEQPDAADVQRDHGPGGGAVAVDELGRATPDVDHQRVPVTSKPGGGAAGGCCSANR